MLLAASKPESRERLRWLAVDSFPAMPVETAPTAEAPDPDRIGHATEQLPGTAIENDHVWRFLARAPTSA